MKVYCYPVDRKSSYVPLLFAGIEDAYQPIYRQDGSLRDALDDLAAGRDVIVHVHWEEFVLRDCGFEAEADAAAAAFVAELAAISDHYNGTIVWTIHNELPHEIPFHRQFLALRRALARYADAILVHNDASRDVLAAQVTLDLSRVRKLLHPSYLGRHENEATLQAGLSEPPDQCIAGFGWIREQKGFGQMIGMLPADFLQARGAYIRISGYGPGAAAVMAQHAHRPDVQWDIRHVPDAEIPDLLRSASCVVLPYERVLTSGVALLALSVGALIVAVDCSQLRELLPARSLPFLYARGDARAFRTIIDHVFELSLQERREILEANLAVARALRPSIIAQRLAAIYREVMAMNARSGTGTA